MSQYGHRRYLAFSSLVPAAIVCNRGRFALWRNFDEAGVVSSLRLLTRAALYLLHLESTPHVHSRDSGGAATGLSFAC